MPASRNDDLVLERQGVGVPDLDDVGALATLPAGQVAGGDDQLARVGIQHVLPGEAEADHAQVCAGIGVDHVQLAVRDVVDAMSPT
jgi:hypothetical protein